MEGGWQFFNLEYGLNGLTISRACFRETARL
jgi:hypothetical protein